MGNDIETGCTTGSDYWADYVGGAKIKTEGLKRQTQTDVITHFLLQATLWGHECSSYLMYNNVLKRQLFFRFESTYCLIKYLQKAWNLKTVK